MFLAVNVLINFLGLDPLPIHCHHLDNFTRPAISLPSTGIAWFFYWTMTWTVTVSLETTIDRCLLHYDNGAIEVIRLDSEIHASGSDLLTPHVINR